MISVDEVKTFQQRVVFPRLNAEVHGLLAQREWMGLAGAGKTWDDLSVEDAQTVIAALGASAFRVVRMSPNLPAILREKTGPLVVAGGSCLITSADTRRLLKKGVAAIDLSADLPNLHQVLDALTPVTGADIHLDILEDTLFANGNLELLRALQAQSARHVEMFARFAQCQGVNAPRVLPCRFSDLPIDAACSAFFKGPFFCNGRRVNGGLGRAAVIWSFTGHWAQMLREQGVIPKESVYVVAEPFHHFTETYNPKFGSNESSSSLAFHRGSTFTLSDAEQAYRVMGTFFREHPYGFGENTGAQGAICFLPSVEPCGRLSFDSAITPETCHRYNVEAFLTLRREQLQQKRIPVLTDDLLFTDGMNALYADAECRAALLAIADLWVPLEAERRKRETEIMGVKGTAYRQAVKDVSKRLRESEEVRHVWQEPHELLYERFERLVRNVFA